MKTQTIYLFALTFVLLSLMNPVQGVSDCSVIAVTSQMLDASVPDASVYLNESHAMVAKENWTGTLGVTNEAIGLYPANPAFRCINGYALRKLGRYQEAVDQVSHAIVFDREAVRYANRGYSYLAMGNNAAALDDAESGISRNATYPATYAVKALALNTMGRNAEALTAIDKAIALEPGSAHFWHVKGRILTAAGDCRDARESFEQSLALDPDYDQPWPGFASARVDLAILGSTCRPSAGEA
jgi:tetratricopeptide (TPR) repeat protein